MLFRSESLPRRYITSYVSSALRCFAVCSFHVPLVKKGVVYSVIETPDYNSTYEPEANAARYGMQVNPKTYHVMSTLEKLGENQVRYGAPYCPYLRTWCRHPNRTISARRSVTSAWDSANLSGWVPSRFEPLRGACKLNGTAISN